MNLVEKIIDQVTTDNDEKMRIKTRYCVRLFARDSIIFNVVLIFDRNNIVISVFINCPRNNVLRSTTHNIILLITIDTVSDYF